MGRGPVHGPGMATINTNQLSTTRRVKASDGCPYQFQLVRVPVPLATPPPTTAIEGADCGGSGIPSGTQFALHFSISGKGLHRHNNDPGVGGSLVTLHEFPCNTIRKTATQIYSACVCDEKGRKGLLVTVTSVKMIVDSRVRICGLILAYFVTCRHSQKVVLLQLAQKSETAGYTG